MCCYLPYPRKTHNRRHCINNTLTLFILPQMQESNKKLFVLLYWPRSGKFVTSLSCLFTIVFAFGGRGRGSGAREEGGGGGGGRVLFSIAFIQNKA
jgi:hypothetical protein